MVKITNYDLRNTIYEIMRHRKKKLQLNRFTSWRRQTVISLVKNLLIQQSIRTTKTKALAAKPLIDRLISRARVNTLTAKRQAYEILGSHRLINLLFNDIAPRFNDKTSGYTRIINLDKRRGDNAQLVVLELTEIRKKQPPKPKKEKKVTPEEEKKPKEIKEKPIQEKRPIPKKPSRKFLGGLRKIFKKERDSL